MGKSKYYYYVSATSERSAMLLLQDVDIDRWRFVPWGNSYEREQVLEPLKKKGLSRSQLIGYFTEGEIFDLTGSF